MHHKDFEFGIIYSWPNSQVLPILSLSFFLFLFLFYLINFLLPIVNNICKGAKVDMILQD